MNWFKIGVGPLLATICMATAACSQASSKPKCSSLIITSSGNQPELAHEASLIASFFSLYVHTLAGIPKGNVCTLSISAIGDLDVQPGYALSIDVVGNGVKWASREEIRTWFPEHSRQVFDHVKKLVRDGVLKPIDKGLFEIRPLEDVKAKFCKSLSTEEPLPPAQSQSFRLEYYEQFQRKPMCSFLCENLIIAAPELRVQTEHLAEESYPAMIYEGRRNGRATFDLRLAKAYHYIDGNGLFDLSGAERPFTARRSKLEASRSYRFEENGITYGGHMISINNLIQTDHNISRKIATSIKFRPDPLASILNELKYNAHYGIESCSTSIKVFNVIQAEEAILQNEWRK